MADVEIWYEGDLRTRCVFQETGTELVTDAPKDNQGLGRTFSPTDLVGVALGSCVLTIMGILARRLTVDLKGVRMVVKKEIAKSPPRRIQSFCCDIYMPNVFTPDVVKQIEHAAHSCPVHHSLHPDIVQEFRFHWGEV